MAAWVYRSPAAVFSACSLSSEPAAGPPLQRGQWPGGTGTSVAVERSPSTMAWTSPVIFGTGDQVVEMEDTEVENLAVSISSDVDAEFDAVIGHIEDIIMGEEFQVLQRHFMDKYYLEFENTEENKLCYTTIFQEYVDLLEKYIEQQLIERIPAFNMTTFITSLQQHKDEISGDIFDMLLTFTDFLAFKEMFLDYRMEKEGHGLDFSGDLIVTPLSKSSSLSPASNNILPLQ